MSVNSAWLNAFSLCKIFGTASQYCANLFFSPKLNARNLIVGWRIIINILTKVPLGKRSRIAFSVERDVCYVVIILFSTKQVIATS